MRALRCAHRLPTSPRARSVKRMKAMWRPFDWTRKLEGGDLHGKAAAAKTSSAAAAGAK